MDNSTLTWLAQHRTLCTGYTGWPIQEVSEGAVTMRIPDNFLDCVIYLYRSVADAEAGANGGGSGFLVAVPAKQIPGASFIFAVTNKHVIDSGADVIRLNTKDGKRRIVETDPRNWTLHPKGDDIAIILMQTNQDSDKVAWVSREQFLSPQIVSDHKIGPGDEVFVIGRFINHEGKQRNTPSVRFGHIAQMPHEPIKRDDGFLQESFLVEAKSIGGYSGSPVFAYINSLLPRPDSNVLSTRILGPWLLGIDWSHLNDWKPVCDASGFPMGTGLQVGSNTGMMGVVPAWKLEDIFQLPDVQAWFAMTEDAELKKRGPPAATPDAAASSGQQPGPFKPPLLD